LRERDRKRYRERERERERELPGSMHERLLATIASQVNPTRGSTGREG
jgi:hypothetical protein